ncbi:hypothetical protein cypCar_00009534 [Cyprinus carpio]|nr:hypothetical protein cypCar_00009534 [Cyprinus carpio]
MKFKTVCYLLVQLMHCRKMFKAEIPFSNVMTCEDDDKRRALRTASEKLRNRTSFSAGMVQNSPGTRVNRYIGRLIEARQTESETADLNYITLTYRSREREQRCSPDCLTLQIRMVLCGFLVLLMYSVTQGCVVECVPWSLEGNSNVSMVTVVTVNRTGVGSGVCKYTPYVFLSCVMASLSVALYLRVSSLPKILLLLLLNILHTVVMETSGYRKAIGVGFFHTHGYDPVLAMLLFSGALVLHCRQLDLKLRLDYLWATQAEEERDDMERVKLDNKRILFNLLPAHVAQHFLLSNPRNMDLYYQSYSQVGVLFASIPNFNDFYIELDGNNMGVECLRLLNEIIADFDALMDKECYRDIEKIKTIGSTYMAAVGLVPTAGSKVKKSISVHLCTVADFAIEMFDVLDAINYQSYNDFVLRVGINVGPVVAGVIGARRPQYDIWGNTVNVASRMDSTGIQGKIQVTEDVFRLLSGYYHFQCRGQVSVKGKGQMLTYFLEGRTAQAGQHMQPKSSERGSSPCIRTKLGSAPAVSSYGVKSHTAGHVSTPNNSIMYLPSVSVNMEMEV